VGGIIFYEAGGRKKVAEHREANMFVVADFPTGERAAREGGIP